MKCFKCDKVFRDVGEVFSHMKTDHGVSGKKDFNCLECELPFENLVDFKEHLRTCKRMHLNDPHTESDDFEMAFETTDVDEDEFEADGMTGERDQPIIINESDNSEDCEMLSETSDVRTAEVESGADGMTDDSDELKLKSVLASWGVTPLYDNLIACGINYQNMCYLDSSDLYIVLGNDKHLLGYMVEFRHLLRQYSTDSTSNTSDTLKTRSSFVNVSNILNQSDEGNAFINKYHNLKLDDNLRSQLVRIILKETFSKAMTLSRSCLNDMAIKICKIFTKEKKEVYYHKLPKQSPTGILYIKYTNMRHIQLNKERLAAAKDLDDTNNELKTVQAVEEEEERSNDLQSDTIDTDSELGQSTTDIESSIKFIKDYTQDSDKKLLLEHWKMTFKHRQEKFKEYKDIDEIFAEWPPLKRETSYALLSIDFLLEYGLEISNGLNNWNSFFERNLAAITNIIKDPLIRKQLNGLNSSTSPETNNKTIIMALHHLLIPAQTIVNGEFWKPTVLMSQKSFMKVVNGEQIMKKEMTKRDNFCKSYGMKSHPVIFEITTCMGTRYNVCIKDVSYKMESLLQGIDIAYKMFKIFGIEFPLECRKVWKFIEHIFYVEDENISGKLLSIISDMNTE